MAEYIGLVVVLVLAVVLCGMRFVYEWRHRDDPFGRMDDDWRVGGGR